jgi:hypothetical protein
MESGEQAFELSVQLGRIYGRLLARIAHGSVQLWVSVVESRPQAADVDDRLRVVAAAETFDVVHTDARSRPLCQRTLSAKVR